MSELFFCEKRTKALQLLKLGLNVSIVGQYTELGPSVVRSLYKQLFNKASKSGPLKEINSILKRTRNMIQAALLLKFYLQIGKNPEKEVDLYSFIKAYSLYQEAFIQTGLLEEKRWQLLDINHAWLLCRGIVSKQISLKTCHRGCTYVEVTNQHLKLECQLCLLLKRVISTRKVVLKKSQ